MYSVYLDLLAATIADILDGVRAELAFQQTRFCYTGIMTYGSDRMDLEFRECTILRFHLLFDHVLRVFTDMSSRSPSSMDIKDGRPQSVSHT